MRFDIFVSLILVIADQVMASVNEPIIKPDQVNLTINENVRINSEYFLTTLTYGANTDDSFEYELKLNCLLKTSKFDLNVIKLNNTQIISEKLYLIIKSKLDYEIESVYRLCLNVINKNTGKIANVVDVFIKIIDLNDNAPIFEHAEYETSILEDQEAPIQLLNLNIKATDRDSNQNGRVSYALDLNQGDEPFVIDSNSGIVTCTQKLSKKVKSIYKLKLIAYDNGVSQLRGYAQLTIKVRNQNVNKPNIKFLFADALFSYDFTDILHDTDNATLIDETKIAENTLEGSFICYILVTNFDAQNKLITQIDENENFKLEQVDFGSTFGASNNNNNNDEFTISNLYSLTLASKLDRELCDKYELNINVMDEFGFKKSFKKLRIFVTDSNDNTPKFESDFYELNVVDNQIGCLDYYVKAYDSDLGLNGTIEYFIESNTCFGMDKQQNLFQINSKTGQFCVIQKTDRVKCKKYLLKIKAKDMGQTPLISNDIEVFVNVQDLSNPLYFYQNEILSLKNPDVVFRVKRNYDVNTEIGWIQAFDFEFGALDTLKYEIEEKFRDFFVIKNGVLYSTHKRIEQNLISFKIRVIQNAAQTEMNCTIELIDYDDTQLQILNPNGTKVIIFNETFTYRRPLVQIKAFAENQALKYEIESLKNDSNDPLECSNMDVNNLFRISQNGEIYLKTEKFYNTKICFLSVLITIENTTITNRTQLVILLSTSMYTYETLTNMALNFKLYDQAFSSTLEYLLSGRLGVDGTSKLFGLNNIHQAILILIMSIFSVIGLLLICAFLLIKYKQKQFKHNNDNKNEKSLFVSTTNTSSSTSSSTCNSTTSSILHKASCSINVSTEESIGSNNNKDKNSAIFWFDSHNNNNSNGKYIDKEKNNFLKQQLDPIIHWSPSCTPLKTTSISPISSINTTNDCCQIKPIIKNDEGCYGSSDMSGDSIDASSSLKPILNSNNNNNTEYFGVYHLNSNQILVTNELKSKQSSLKTTKNNNKNRSSTCNTQMEKFEKIYYDPELSKAVNDKYESYEIRGSFV